MDSTSKLFSRLDLRTHSPHKDKGIVDMEIDIAEDSNAPSLNPKRGPRRNAHTDGNYTEQQHRRARLVQLINDTLETERSSNAQDEALECEQDKAFSGADKRMGSYHRPHKGLWRKKGKEQFPVFDGGDFVLESKEKRGGFVSGGGPFQHGVPWRDRGQRRLGHHGYVAPHNSARGRISRGTGHVGGEGIGDLVDEEKHSSFTKISNKNKMIEVDSPSLSRHRTGQRHHIWSNRDSLRKNAASRWQVQNGCTSRHNNKLGGNGAKDYGFGTMMQCDRLDWNLSHQHIVSPDCEDRHLDKKKGKMILEDDIFRVGLNTNSEQSSDRLYSLERKEVTSTVDNDIAFISPDDVAWKRHDHRSKSPFLPSEDSNCISKIGGGTSVYWSDPRPKNTMEKGNYHNLVDGQNITTSHRLNLGLVHAPSDLANGSGRRDRRRRKSSKGKRKCNSVYSNYGGSSSSAFENSETSHLLSSRHVSYSRPGTADYQHHGEFFDPVMEVFDPVMEVDEPQSPEERFNYFQEQTVSIPDHSSARASQIESDEILARQLQEQFYDEVAGSAGTEEIDATTAWSLQQEDAQLAAASARSGQLDHEQEESMAHLYAYYAQLPYRNSSTRWPNHTRSLTSNTRRNFYGSENDLETRMMAGVRNFTGMDSVARRNFLDEWEAAFDQSNDALAESNHDFDENDYEMLLALDENNIHHPGASESQINCLPQSIIQSDNVEEACAICLEDPLYGDIIRRLPCLHKFHKECIDTWLRRKSSCPVCKSEIT